MADIQRNDGNLVPLTNDLVKKHTIIEMSELKNRLLALDTEIDRHENVILPRLKVKKEEISNDIKKLANDLGKMK